VLVCLCEEINHHVPREQVEKSGLIIHHKTPRSINVSKLIFVNTRLKLRSAICRISDLGSHLKTNLESCLVCDCLSAKYEYRRVILRNTELYAFITS
jgi:hypothetical protein